MTTHTRSVGSAGRVGDYLAELRAPFLTASVLPVLVGAGFAASRGQGRLSDVALMVAGAALIHSGANVANDYYDARSGCDEGNTAYIRPFTGGSRLIQSGRLTPGQVAGLSASLFAAGSLAGFCLAMRHGLWVLAAGGLAAVLGWAYSAPPLRLAGRGLGELTVALAFGLLPVVASDSVMSDGFDVRSVWLSLPVALLIAGVLLANEVPDMLADGIAGKRTLVVRLGPWAAWLHAGCMGLWPVPLAWLVWRGAVPPAALTAFLFFPLGVAASVLLVRGGMTRNLKAVCGLTLATHAGCLVSLAAVLLLHTRRNA
jgi:1,4-dihydroxy-2-naphthoate polyprenyltransferase